MNTEINENKCIDCQKAKEDYFSLYKLTNIEHERYAMVVSSIGYAAFLTILNNCHQQFFAFSKKITIFMYMSLALSILIFVFFEILKAKETSDYRKEQTENIYKLLSNINIFSYQDLFQTNAQLTIKSYNLVLKYIDYFFYSSLIFAGIAFCLFLFLGINILIPEFNLLKLVKLVFFLVFII